MEQQEINISRFFDDKDVASFVELKQSEAYFLITYEFNVMNSEGLGQTSGGFANIIFNDVDEEDTNVITGVINVGIQNDCENKVYTDNITFNRKTLEVNYE